MNAANLNKVDYGTGEKTLEIYSIGLMVCVFLTLLPFAAVMYPVLSHATTVGLVVACALSQFVVQLICFLRLNYNTEQAMLNVRSFALSLFIIFILMAGSLWIMWTLDYRMMH